MNQDASNPFGDTAAFPASLSSLNAVRRPGGLTAICILAIILGSLGLLSSLTQVANLAGGRQMQQAFSGMGPMGGPEQLRDVQDEFNTAVADVADKYFWVSTITVAVQILLAGSLIYGGAYTLRLESRGHRVLGVACLVGVFFELLRIVPYVMIQLDMLPVFQEYMPRIMESTVESGDQAAEIGAGVAATIARLTAILGIVFFCGWCLVKVVFYGIANRYLKKSDIRRLFETQPLKLG